MQRPAQGPAATHVAQSPHPQQQSQAAHSQPASRAVPQAAPPPPDDRESSDWGLEPARSGISRENKFILFVLLVLVAVFSFVVFRNFQKKQNSAKTDLASKDEKKPAKDAKKAGAKKGSKAEEAEAPPLQEPNGAEAQASTELIANTGTEQPADDPFGNAPTMNEGPAATAETSPDLGQALAEDATQVSEAPPQLNATPEGAPQQTTDLFEPPAQGAEAAEVAEMQPPAQRGRGPAENPQELAETAPNRVNEPLQADPMESEPMQQAVATFNAEAPATEDAFAQTAGTAAEPIRRRGTSPRAGRLETAQVPTPADPLNGQQEAFAPTTPRATTPGATAPRTATTPRNAPPPVPVPPATQPRVSAPPPLDPNDERLGGYREAQLPGAPGHRTTARPPAAAGQFNPLSGQLVENVGEYTIRPNDNYWRISRKVYGTARYFAALARHNEAIIPDPKHMKPGLKISTPPKEQLEQQYRNLLPVMEASRPVGAVMTSPHAPKSGFYTEADGQPAYRIGPSDTLSTISKKTLGRSTRWDEIYELNKDRMTGPDALAIGSILRLPPDASQTQVVGKPVQHR